MTTYTAVNDCLTGPPAMSSVNFSTGVWASTTFSSLTFCDASDGGCPAPAGDNASFAVAWDNTALYVAVNVSDTNLNKNGGGNIWQDSAVEIFMDIDNSKHNDPCGNYSDTKDYQWIIVYDCSQEGEFHNPTNRTILYASNVTVGTGYQMQVEIPWANLGPVAGYNPPSIASISGFDVAVDYANAAGNRTEQIMAYDPSGNPGGTDWTCDPATWADLAFGPCPDTPTPTYTPTPTASPSVTPTNTPSLTPSPTPSITVTFTLTSTPSQTPTATPSRSPTVTPTFSISPTALPTPDPTPGAFYLHLLSANPDPFGSDGVYLPFFISLASQVSIQIYTVSGELVRSLEPEPYPLGYNERFWDGKNQSGRAVASGVFIYRVQADSASGSQADFSRCAAVR